MSKLPLLPLPSFHLEISDIIAYLMWSRGVCNPFGDESSYTKNTGTRLSSIYWYTMCEGHWFASSSWTFKYSSIWSSLEFQFFNSTVPLIYKYRYVVLMACLAPTYQSPMMTSLLCYIIATYPVWFMTVVMGKTVRLKVHLNVRYDICLLYHWCMHTYWLVYHVFYSISLL